MSGSFEKFQFAYISVLLKGSVCVSVEIIMLGLKRINSKSAKRNT